MSACQKLNKLNKNWTKLNKLISRECMWTEPIARSSWLLQQKPKGTKKFGQLLSLNKCLPCIKMVRKIMTRSVYIYSSLSSKSEQKLPTKYSTKILRFRRKSESMSKSHGKFSNSNVLLKAVLVLLHSWIFFQLLIIFFPSKTKLDNEIIFLQDRRIFRPSGRFCHISFWRSLR